LPDIILEIDSRTKISTTLLGRQPETAQELVALYAGLLAHGTEIDAKAAASMISGVPVSHVSAAMRMLEAPGRLRATNDSVVAFQQPPFVGVRPAPRPSVWLGLERGS